MEKSALDKLKELERKGSARSEGENTEYETLFAQKQDADNLKSAMAECLKDTPLLKSLAKDIGKFTNQSDKENSAGYKLSQLLVGIKRGDPEMIKAADPMNETTSADGGYLVPVLTEAKILELSPTYGQARKIMEVFPMTGNQLIMPKEGVLPTWTWGIAENTSITSSKPTIGTFTMTPKKGGALIVMSSELFMDANVKIGDYIIRKAVQARGTAEDQQFFKGTGSPFTGIFNTSNTFGNTVTASGNGSTITYTDLVNCTYGVDQNYLVNAQWLMSRSQVAVVRGLLDINGRPIFEPASNGMPAMLLGYPVVVAENAPTTATVSGQTQILLGDFRNSYIGDVEGLRTDFFREATIDGTSLAQYDLVAIRMLSREAFNAGYTQTYSRIRQAV